MPKIFFEILSLFFNASILSEYVFKLFKYFFLVYENILQLINGRERIYVT